MIDLVLCRRRRRNGIVHVGEPLVDDLGIVLDRRSFAGPKFHSLSLELLKIPFSVFELAAVVSPNVGFSFDLVEQVLGQLALTQDPVAFAWGSDGKFWVVEMADYPLGIDGKGKHGGRVRYLEDADGDGTYDKSTLFLEGIGYPTGVMPWRRIKPITCDV